MSKRADRARENEEDDSPAFDRFRCWFRVDCARKYGFGPFTDDLLERHDMRLREFSYDSSTSRFFSLVLSSILTAQKILDVLF